MRIISVLLALTAIALSGCASSGKAKPDEPTSFQQMAPEEQAVYRAILTKMFAHCEASGAGRGLPRRYFLTLCNKDAPADLLAEVRKLGRDASPGSLYRDGLGVALFLGTIQHTTTGLVRVEGRYRFGAHDGESGPFILNREEGAWVVISWEPDVFSANSLPSPGRQTCLALGTR